MVLLSYLYTCICGPKVDCNKQTVPLGLRVAHWSTHLENLSIEIWLSFFLAWNTCYDGAIKELILDDTFAIRYDVVVVQKWSPVETEAFQAMQFMQK